MPGSKDNKKKKSSPVFVIIIIICLAVAAYAAYNLICIWLEYKAGQDEYNALRKYTVETTDTDTEAADATLQSDIHQDTDTEKPPIDIDFASLKNINSDIAGWLYIGAENISYPVVHYSDNEFYLHRTFEKTDNFAGTLFIEYQNKADLSDPNTIIYGHNMKDRSMFGKLKLLYENGDYANDDTFWIITEKTAYKYKMFSIHRTVDTSDVYTLFSGPCEDVKSYIADNISESLVQLPIDSYDENSKVVTLSTCQAATGEERLVVQGILVKEVALN